MKPAVKALMTFGTISVVPMTVAVPVNWRPPMATSPDPMVVAPSPTSTHPDVSRGGADGYGLHHRRRHFRGHDDRGGSHYYGGWSYDRDSEVDAETNPGARRGDCQGRQGQNCDSLFHNV